MVSLSTIITGVCAAWGLLAGHSFLWIPCSGFAASIAFDRARPWATSNRQGEWIVVSLVLKLAANLVGFYAVLAMFACVGLSAYWLFWE